MVFFVVFLLDFLAFFIAMALSPPFSVRKCKGGEMESQSFFSAVSNFFGGGKITAETRRACRGLAEYRSAATKNDERRCP